MEYVCTLLRVARPNALSIFEVFGGSNCNTNLLEGTIEVIYVYCFTNGSVRSESITVRSDSGNPSSGKLWYLWIAAVAETKCSWNLVSVMNLLNRDSPVGWICRRNQNCQWRVKSILVFNISRRSVGVSFVDGQNKKSFNSMEYQCWLGSLPRSKGINQLFVISLVQNLPNFNDCHDKAGSQE